MLPTVLRLCIVRLMQPCPRASCSTASRVPHRGKLSLHPPLHVEMGKLTVHLSVGPARHQGVNEVLPARGFHARIESAVGLIVSSLPQTRAGRAYSE